MTAFRFGSLTLALATAGVLLVPAPLPAQSKDRNLITRAELLRSAQKTKDLFEAIRSLKPHFISPLTSRTQGNESRSLPKPVVYIDGNFAGELDVLRSILVNNVEEVRFKSPTEASVELGPNAPGGAIMVKMYKEAKP